MTITQARTRNHPAKATKPAKGKPGKGKPAKAPRTLKTPSRPVPEARKAPFPAPQAGQEGPKAPAPSSGSPQAPETAPAPSPAPAKAIPAKPAPAKPFKTASAIFGKELQDALSLAVKVAEAKSTIPILATVLMKRKGSKSITLTTTNLDQRVTVDVPADKVDAGFEACVPAATLLKSLRAERKADTVTLTTEPDSLALDFGDSALGLPKLDPADFPETMGEATYDRQFEIDAPALVEAIGQVLFAVSSEETRYYLQGAFLHTADRRLGLEIPRTLRMVSTDGHRLALQDMPGVKVKTMAGGTPKDGLSGIIVPKEALLAALAFFDKRDDKVTVETGKGFPNGSPRIRFTAGEIVLESKGIDGTFPDYNRAIPQYPEPIAFKVDAREMEKAVRKIVASFPDRSGRAIKFQLQTNALNLSYTDGDGVTAKACLPVEYAGPDNVTGYNGRYVLDILAHFEGKVTWNLQDKDPQTFGGPCRIDGEKPEFFSVLMPMRV